VDANEHFARSRLRTGDLTYGEALRSASLRDDHRSHGGIRHLALPWRP
jgi:hypothetical protein